MAVENVSKKLSDLLVTRNLNPEMRDVMGKTVNAPEAAEMFTFEFTPASGQNYGTVVCFLGDDNSLQLFYADNVGKGMEDSDKEEWYQFLQQISQFAKRNRLSFDLKNINKLRYTMQGQAALKEGLFESWSGKKNVSYNGGPDAVRLMIKHNRDIKENELRHRHIDSLFVETSDGERFKLPFKSLAGGRAMCEHIRAGGKPYDPKGQQISNIVNEVATLTRFSRARPETVFESDTLVTEAREHLRRLKETLKALGTRKGYNTYFEYWNPASITDEDLMVEQVRNSLVTQDIDSRIEDALPVLARLPGACVAESEIFESWANDLCRGII